MRKPTTARIKVAFTPSPEFFTWKARLDELVDDPEVFQQMLRYAMAKTFLKAVRDRFIRNLPEALHVHLADHDPRPVKPGKDIERSFMAALDEMTEANASGDSGAVDKASRRLRRIRQAYQNALQGNHGRDSKRPSRFVELVSEAMRVLDAMASPRALHSAGSTKARSSVGLGALGELEAIRTPTGNRSGHTESSMSTLWKQLEFGTGIYALDKGVNRGSRFKERSGSGEWWWGPERGRGVLVAGSMPINALLYGVDLADRPETAEFTKMIRALLAQALAL